jgi:hypothetical protein
MLAGRGHRSRLQLDATYESAFCAVDKQLSQKFRQPADVLAAPVLMGSFCDVEALHCVAPRRQWSAAATTYFAGSCSANCGASRVSGSNFAGSAAPFMEIASS